MLHALCLICALLFAAPDGTDDRAHEALRALEARMEAMPVYEVRFGVESDENRFEGAYTVDGDRYCMQLDGGELFTDGTARYEVNRGNREVLIDRLDGQEQNLLTDPAAAFRFIASDYAIRYGGEEPVDGRPCDRIRLEPLQPGSLRCITLWLDRRTQLPAQLEYATGGGAIRIRIERIRPLPDGVDPDLFRFRPERYPGYEVIDFR